MTNIGTRIYLRPSQVAALKLIVANYGETFSAHVRDGIDLYLDETRRQHPERLAPLQPRRNHDAT